MRTFHQNDPLTDAELDRLGDLFKSCEAAGRLNVKARRNSSSRAEITAVILMIKKDEIAYLFCASLWARTFSSTGFPA